MKYAHYSLKWLVLSAVLLLVAHSSGTAQPQLRGYSTGQLAAPDGTEWQNPEAYAHGKLPPRALVHSFADHQEALGVLPEHSSYIQSLDGLWRFRWVGNPQERTKDFYTRDFDDSLWDQVTVPMNWNIYGIQPNGALKYGTPIYLNQRVPFYHEVKVGDWQGGVMRTPPQDYTTYRHRNEVGAYRRRFSLPHTWRDGRRVYINFDGVDSFFYLWINGQYIGFSKNSRNSATFDISPYVTAGENTVAVEVYRYSDGSFLESQDMFRLPGIFRSVSLYSKPELQVEDLQITPDLSADYQQAVLRLCARIANYAPRKTKALRLRYSLYSLPLYSDTPTSKVLEASTELVKAPKRGSSLTLPLEINVPNPRLWSAEMPYRYLVVGELITSDQRGEPAQIVETVSAYTGLRKVELKHVPAQDDEFGRSGRYFLLNGQTIKLKGVNRHETHPAVGHALTRRMMEDDVMLMKRANINHVRNAHYPTDPYFYYLCDKYGIYLEDEANIESHEYYYGQASLSHVREFDIATTNRTLEMVYAHYNHPSIVIWSLGNEAGPGDNFKRSYAALKQVDTTRPVQYERNNDIVDIGSNQYPSIPWVQRTAQGLERVKYPFHISEYAHSMGNAVGGLQDYWTAIESSNHIFGAAIWDWVDQAMYHYLPSGQRYLAYGGDFGDIPNDGMFVMNGILLADRTPKPQYYEVKKVYQNVGISAERLLEDRKFRLMNKHYFSDLNDFVISAMLYEDGRPVHETQVGTPYVAPRSSVTLSLATLLSYPLRPECEYFVKIQLKHSTARPWCAAEYVQAEEQLPLRAALHRPRLDETSIHGYHQPKTIIAKAQHPDQTIVRGDHFELVMDDQQGTIHSLTYYGQEIIPHGGGPRIDLFRAVADNDNWAYQAWGKNGLHNLQHKAVTKHWYRRSDGVLVYTYFVLSQAKHPAEIKTRSRWPSESSGHYYIEEDTTVLMQPNDFMVTTDQSWFIYPDGSIELKASIRSNRPDLPLGRLGYGLRVNKHLSQYAYYGRGPVNNYSDRKTGQFIEQHTSRVEQQFVDFPKPQTMGNREDVRWVSLRGVDGVGVSFQAAKTMSCSALPWSALELLLAPHPYQLPPMGDTHLHLDASVNGLGGNSCGQGGPLEPYRSYARPTQFGFVIRPLASGEGVRLVALE